jgi:hypothetical protein
VEVETHYDRVSGKVKKVYANGVEVPFTQDGSSVNFSPDDSTQESWEERWKLFSDQLCECEDLEERSQSKNIKDFIRTAIETAKNEALDTFVEVNFSQAPDKIILHGDWLTIGDAPSFMLSKKNAERLRDYVNLIEEAQIGGGGTNAK